MSRSPFADEPGFLSFEEFLLLKIGTEVETYDTRFGVIGTWKRDRITECDVFPHALISGTWGVPGYFFLTDAGIVPYSSNWWNEYHYTRLATPKPSPTKPVAVEKLTSALNDVIAAVEKVKEIVNE